MPGIVGLVHRGGESVSLSAALGKPYDLHTGKALARRPGDDTDKYVLRLLPGPTHAEYRNPKYQSESRLRGSVSKSRSRCA